MNVSDAPLPHFLAPLGPFGRTKLRSYQTIAPRPLPHPMDDDTAPTIGARDLVGRLIGRSAPEDGPVLQAALDEYRATARRSDDRRRMLRAIIARVGRPLVRDVLEEAAAERWGWSGARECTELFEGSDSMRDVEARVAARASSSAFTPPPATASCTSTCATSSTWATPSPASSSSARRTAAAARRCADPLRGRAARPRRPAARRWRFTPPRGAARGVGRTPTEAIRAYLDAAQAAEVAAEAAPAGDDAEAGATRESAAATNVATRAGAGRDECRDARERGRDECRDCRPSLRTFIADEMDREAAVAAPAPENVAPARDERIAPGRHGRGRRPRLRLPEPAPAPARVAELDDDDVVCTGERTWAERDAALRAAAVDLD